MKIVRTVFNASGSNYAIDRKYDEEKSNEQNCDETMRFIASMMEQGKVLAVMHVVSMDEKSGAIKKSTPALLNTSHVESLYFVTSGVYTDEQQ